MYLHDLMFFSILFFILMQLSLLIFETSLQRIESDNRSNLFSFCTSLGAVPFLSNFMPFFSKEVEKVESIIVVNK